MASNPAGASRLQSLRPVRRVAELGSFGDLARLREKMDHHFSCAGCGWSGSVALVATFAPSRLLRLPRDCVAAPGDAQSRKDHLPIRTYDGRRRMCRGLFRDTCRLCPTVEGPAMGGRFYHRKLRGGAALSLCLAGCSHRVRGLPLYHRRVALRRHGCIKQPHQSHLFYTAMKSPNQITGAKVAGACCFMRLVLSRFSSSRSGAPRHFAQFYR